MSGEGQRKLSLFILCEEELFDEETAQKHSNILCAGCHAAAGSALAEPTNMGKVRFMLDSVTEATTMTRSDMGLPYSPFWRWSPLSRSCSRPFTAVRTCHTRCRSTCSATSPTISTAAFWSRRSKRTHLLFSLTTAFSKCCRSRARSSWPCRTNIFTPALSAPRICRSSATCSPRRDPRKRHGQLLLPPASHPARRGLLPVLLNCSFVDNILYCVMMDNTREHDIIEELEFERERYRVLFDKSDEILFDVDFVTQSFFMSKKFKEKFGWDPPDHYWGNNLPRLLHFL